MAELRRNRVKHKLQQGKPAIILGVNDPDTIDAIGPLGVIDGVWIEMEHGPVTWRELTNLSRACDLWGITSMVRVNHGDPWLISRTMDQGVQGIIVPHVNTKEEAQLAVEGAKYTPQGQRGMYGTRQGFGVSDYHRKANDEVMVTILIEDVVAVKNLAEILTVDNIDCFFVARSDLSQTMGIQYLGQPDHPEVMKVADRVMKQIVAAGKATGAVTDDNNIEHMLEMGCRFLLTSTQRYVNSGLQQFQKKVGTKVPL